MSSTASGLCMGCMSSLDDYIVCPHCGYDNSTPYDKMYKKPGTVLAGRYLVGRLVRHNGEGATYVGYDNNLQCRVWVKEYFPTNLAGRDPATGEVAALEGRGAQFKALMSDFIDVCNEVKRLSITEPVVPIENVIGEHGTAYAIYKDMEVIPLESYLQKKGGKLPVSEARSLLLPLLNTLSNIHARGEIHRGISPYTVYIDRSGVLYLWDFCMSATRTGCSELEAELFNGYSAPEQYASNGWQGTWTDVYGVAAVFYRTVSGFVPPKSTLINAQRPLAPLMDLVMDIPQNISDAISYAMTQNTELRTQEVGALTSRLVHTDISNTAVYDMNKISEVKKAREEKLATRDEKRKVRKYAIIGLLMTVVVLFVILWVVMANFFPELLGGEKDTMAPVESDDTSESSENSAEESSEQADDKLMPELSGLKAEDIQAPSSEYSGRFLFSIKEEYNDTIEKGVIYDQSPKAGIHIEDGRTVILFVSKGAQTLIMPDMKGMTREEAVEEIKKLSAELDSDLPFDEYTRFESGAKPGTVTGTTPPAEAEFDPKKTTSIVLFFMPAETSIDEASQAQEAKDKESSRMTVEEFRNQSNSQDK